MYKFFNKNDKIGLISPASFITKEKLNNSIANIENFGLKAIYFKSILDKKAYFAGTDKERTNELHKMYADSSLKAILCVRGGYGTSRILNLLDYSLIKENPKPLIGYSDISALLIAIYKKTGQIGFHGVVGASIFNEFTSGNFKEMFLNKKEVVKYDNLKNANNEQYTIFPGKAKGKLIGGNLSILMSLLATNYDVSWENKIVFIEETNEAPYKIDRMLTQLILAGKFKKVKGIIFGTFNKCEGNFVRIKTEDTFSLKEVILERIKPLNIPAVYGFPFGHIENQIILPIGAKACFDACNFKISIIKNFFD